jgi:hypothetical protein
MHIGVEGIENMLMNMALNLFGENMQIKNWYVSTLYLLGNQLKFFKFEIAIHKDDFWNLK